MFGVVHISTINTYYVGVYSGYVDKPHIEKVKKKVRGGDMSVKEQRVDGSSVPCRNARIL